MKRASGNKFGLILVLVILVLFLKIYSVTAKESAEIEETSMPNFLTPIESDGVVKIGADVGNFKPEDIIGNKVIIWKKDSFGITKVAFNGDNSYLTVFGNKFENIQKISPINPASYVNLNEGGEITEAVFRVNEKGGNYTFGKNKKPIPVPPNSLVEFINGKYSIKAPDGSIIKFPEIDTNNVKDEITYQGKNLHFENGNVFGGEGQIIFVDGKTYLSGFVCKIDDLTFLIPNKNPRLRVFFDGEAHPNTGEDYVSLNSDKKKLYLLSEKIQFDISFEKNNPFIEIKEGMTDFRISVNENHYLELGVTNTLGKIPKMSIVSMQGIDKEGKSTMYIDNRVFKFLKNNYGFSAVDYRAITPMPLLAPIEIDFQDGTIPGGKEFLIKDNAYLLVKKSEIENYNKIDTPIPGIEMQIKDIEEENHVTIRGWEKLSQDPVNKLGAELSLLDNSYKTGKEIIIVDLEEGTAGTSNEQNTVRLDKKGGFSVGVLSHEVGHGFIGQFGKIGETTSIAAKQENKEKLVKQVNDALVKNGIDEFVSTDNVEFRDGRMILKVPRFSSDLIPSDVQKEISNAVDLENKIQAVKNPLIRELIEFRTEENGGKYPYLVSPDVSTGTIPNVDLDKMIPKEKEKGKPSAYSKVNPYEEGAEAFSKFTVLTPEQIRELVDPRSDKYEAGMAFLFDRFRKYGGVPVEKYNRVVRGIPLWATIVREKFDPIPQEVEVPLSALVEHAISGSKPLLTTNSTGDGFK